jgi:CO/xanthine dehydrogenase Mo-binding subunit
MTASSDAQTIIIEYPRAVESYGKKAVGEPSMDPLAATLANNLDSAVLRWISAHLRAYFDLFSA